MRRVEGRDSVSGKDGLGLSEIRFTGAELLRRLEKCC
jgi:hypothetical protein